MKQKTLSKLFTISGRGLHTNNECTVICCPADVNHGVVFERTDIEPHPKIKAISENTSSFNRNTTIKNQYAEVATIEHFMSLFYILGIDNMLIKVSNMELPILDGSAMPILAAMQQQDCSVIEQNAEKEYITIKKHITFDDGTSKIEAYPYDGLKIQVEVDFPHHIGKQQVIFDDKTNINMLASSRTFVMLSDILYLYQNNLIKGGSLDNAIVIANVALPEDTVRQLSTIFGIKDEISISEEGILNNTRLRDEHEIGYHKLLDFIGDISLSGKPIRGFIKAYKPGHYANHKFVEELIATM